MADLYENTNSLQAVLDAVNNLPQANSIEIPEGTDGQFLGYDADGNLVAKEVSIPDVPDWAMADSKPTYTASEVGARASTWKPSQTEVTVSAATDYTTNRVRGIALAQDNAISVPNGCLCGVYSVS